MLSEMQDNLTAGEHDEEHSSYKGSCNKNGISVIDSCKGEKVIVDCILMIEI